MSDKKKTIRTDGKREIIVQNAQYVNGGFDISICRNGYQSTIVTMDGEMLLWLRDAIDEHLNKK